MPRRRSSAPRTAPIGKIVLALLLIAVIYLYRTDLVQQWLRDKPSTGQQEQPTRPVGSTLNSTGDIQVFFTTPSLVYPDKPNQRGASPLLQAVLSDIDAAQASIDLATFDFDVVEVAEALLHAKQRSIKVRLVVDSENLSDPDVAEQTGRLEQADIPIRFDEREPFMHNKFLVIDKAIAWTGSWNVTTNDTFRNNNNMLRFANSQISENYAREFQQLFDGAFGVNKRSGTPYPKLAIGTTQVEIYFSPEDGVQQHVLQRLNAAQKSIDFMTFSYTADAVADAMIEQAQRGIAVQGVFERQNAEGTGAEFNRLKANDIDVLKDGNCYILHHKTIVIDQRIVITGSYNFTRSAEEQNDENLVIIDDPAIAQVYMEEYRRLRDQAEQPTRCS